MKRTTMMLAALALLVCGVGQAKGGAIVYDLATDWSNTSNPNGAWSYNGGSTPLPFQASWDPNNVIGFTTTQPAWAFAPQPAVGWTPPGDQIPVWFQSVGTNTPGYDMPQGKVIVHSWDPVNGEPNTEPANVTWTSPIDGTIVISGDTWLARKTLDRSNNWSLSLNGSVLASGTVTSSDAYTSAAPDQFGTFTETVHVGDVVEFEVSQDAPPYGEFEGVDLTIEATPLSASPEPSTLTLIGIGAIGLIGYGWRRRKRAAA